MASPSPIGSQTIYVPIYPPHLTPETTKRLAQPFFLPLFTGVPRRVVLRSTDAASALLDESGGSLGTCSGTSGTRRTHYLAEHTTLCYRVAMRKFAPFWRGGDAR